MKSSTLITLLALSSFTFTGCMPHASSALNEEEKATVEHALNAQQADTSHAGSLWANGGAGLLSDPKAARLGDLVTVLVQETAKATRSLGSKQSKSSDRSTGLNANIAYGGALGNADVNPSGSIGMTNSKTFDGSGSTNNSDTLTASVTSVVTKVYPNGNLYIVGRRQLTINHEPQEITFSGIIRPIDILPDNSISSAKVAQARISYGGAGALATVAHEGWLSQTLDQIWPF
ncbi:flagellar basal body L-ring protein FlgH [Mariprofundus sp. NF]|uniref:flagellar basal body L-ring protein FlgH n=1 Tax=Mariprofundus sp. NF TaxID=2608716 RepID=UPI0015A34F76|nr:flagellar basal body L-ring protein FlgH [Mariprofundus sp. NF]NWF38787.1 flagellar basal body L-ring protein FlgH [Mariprofundus sp. NF]